MNKNDYIGNLNKHTYEKGITVYDYYYNLAKTIRSNTKFTLENWEMSCPFLTSEDYKKLIFSDDPRIEEYFALAMEKVIELNRITSLVPVNAKENNLNVIDNKNNSDNLERTDLIDVINGKMDEVNDSLSRTDINEIIDDEFNNLDNNTLSREDIISEINDEMDRINEDLTRSDISEVVNEEIDNLDDSDSISREDISSIINDEYSKLSKLGIFLTSVSNKISSLLNGFAVVREEKAKKSNLYYHDASKDELKGKRVYENNSLNIESGYYINYQEYFERVLDSLLKRYPNMSDVRFINEDEEEINMNQLASTLFNNLREAGSIKFGNELYENKINSYQDLLDLELGDANYSGEKLRKGIYVRRDVMDDVMSKYKAKVYLNEEEEVNSRSK